MAFDPQQDALWTAVGNRDHDECRRLVARGADVNMVCPDGWVRDECRPKDGAVGRSLLHHAAWAGDEAIFRFLVGAGADPTRRRNTAWRPNGGARGRGSTPLHHAVQYNRAPIVTYLLDEVPPEISSALSIASSPSHYTFARIGRAVATSICPLYSAGRRRHRPAGRAGVHAAAHRGQVQLPRPR